LNPFLAPETADPGAGVVEAAPARARIRLLAFVLVALFAVLAARAGQLALLGDPGAAHAAAASPALLARADLLDRNGELLATTVRGYVLAAEPARVWKPAETAAALKRRFPDLDRAATQRRLGDRSRERVYLRRGLTETDRAAVLELGLAGLAFEEESRRVYPNAALAAHALGFVSRDFEPLAGLERGLNRRLAASPERPVRLSLDLRLQYAVEIELARAAQAARASGGAAIMLDGRSGEILAFASWPALDPNNPGAASAAQRLNRASGSRYEMGSTIKPFTVAMALDDRRVSEGERFDLIAPYAVDTRPIRDYERVAGSAGLREIVAHSSNKGAAMLALRVGAARQREFLARLGLLEAPPLQLAENAGPLGPAAGPGRLDTAVLGYGYGLAVSLAALADAYTVFVNQGARVQPTFLVRAPDEATPLTPVFSPQTAARTLRYMRAAVTEGTAREADIPGLELAGKTGTAEKLGPDAAYDGDRLVSSFVAIFPASRPRYVIALALDEPADTQADGRRATGGAVAAAPVGRIAARIAPMLGLRVEPRGAAQRATPADER
jgi:cell division protein FtsI (penicillin-binding protein 3)